MATFVTTANLPESQRLAFWRDAICGTFLKVDISQVSEQSRPFLGELTTVKVKDIAFSRVAVGDCPTLYERTSLWARQAGEALVFVSLLLRGTCLIAQDGRAAKLEEGDFACYDSTRLYSLRHEKHFEQLVLQMPRELWISRMGPTEPFTGRVVHGGTSLGGLVSNIVSQVITSLLVTDQVAADVIGAGVIGNIELPTAHRLADVAIDLVTAAFGDQLSNKDIAKSSTRISLLYRAKALIEDNLHDPDLCPETVARYLRISVRYLHDLFHEDNSTVSNWIWKRRLERCRRDLSDPLLANKSVSEIAFDGGFNAFPHFAHRFKAAFSKTPSDFRREQLGRRPESDHVYSAELPPLG
jgi:AraC-like DNA-binding protein